MGNKARFLFVGEDKRLAAKSLCDALETNGILWHQCEFRNWFEGTGFVQAAVWEAIDERDMTVVALGDRVSREMLKLEIPHKTLVHPAARGRIRNKARYAQHVWNVLIGSEDSSVRKFNAVLRKHAAALEQGEL